MANIWLVLLCAAGAAGANVGEHPNRTAVFVELEQQQSLGQPVTRTRGLGFNTNGTGYDPIISKNFASLASVAYCDNIANVLDWSCGACKASDTPLVPGKVRVIDGGKDNATRVVVGKLQDQDGCLMAFRGSNNVINWLRNFQFWEIAPASFEDCEGCKVHAGFYTIWKNVRELVLDALSEVGCENSSTKDNLVYVTGHSLGAALTHLAMFTLHNRGWNIAKTYSFEAPRIGNTMFSEAFAERFSRDFPVFRVTHHKDPVVHLPPESFGYTHVQMEVYYDGKGNYKTCNDVEDSLCADQFWDVPSMILFNAGEHCGTPLLANQDFCSPSC